MLSPELPLETQWTLEALAPGAQACIHSVYRVVCERSGTSGSGFLLDNGYLVTAVSVIQGQPPESLKALSVRGQSIRFKNFYLDVERGLALLKPETSLDGGLSLALGAELALGSTVYSWGYPAYHRGPAPLLSEAKVSGFKVHQKVRPVLLRLLAEGEDVSVLKDEYIGIKAVGLAGLKVFYRRLDDGGREGCRIEEEFLLDALRTYAFKGDVLAQSEATRVIYQGIYRLVAHRGGQLEVPYGEVQKRWCIQNSFEPGYSGALLLSALERSTVTGIVLSQSQGQLSTQQKQGLQYLASVEPHATKPSPTQVSAQLLQVLALQQSVATEIVGAHELVLLLEQIVRTLNQQAAAKLKINQVEAALALLLEAEQVMGHYPLAPEVLTETKEHLSHITLLSSEAPQSAGLLDKAAGLVERAQRLFGGYGGAKDQPHLEALQRMEARLGGEAALASSTLTPGFKGLSKAMLLKHYDLEDTPAELEKGLRKAAAQGDTEALQGLIQLGVNVNAAGEQSRATALHWAVRKNHVDCVRILLEADADPTLADHNHQMPAAQTQDAELLSLLSHSSGRPSLK